MQKHNSDFNFLALQAADRSSKLNVAIEMIELLPPWQVRCGCSIPVAQWLDSVCRRRCTGNSIWSGRVHSLHDGWLRSSTSGFGL